MISKGGRGCNSNSRPHSKNIKQKLVRGIAYNKLRYSDCRCEFLFPFYGVGFLSPVIAAQRVTVLGYRYHNANRLKGCVPRVTFQMLQKTEEVE